MSLVLLEKLFWKIAPLPKIVCATSNNGILTAIGATLHGGAIRSSSTASGFPHVTRCQFSENNSQMGGALYIQSPSPLFSNCTFNSNIAQVIGGAAYVTSTSKPTFSNADWIHNVALTDGGAVYCDAIASPVSTILLCICYFFPFIPRIYLLPISLATTMRQTEVLLLQSTAATLQLTLLHLITMLLALLVVLSMYSPTLHILRYLLHPYIC